VVTQARKKLNLIGADSNGNQKQEESDIGPDDSGETKDVPNILHSARDE
jgi:hypothetical protein